MSAHAGGSEFIRVGLVGMQRPDRELAHRLFLTELPQPAVGPTGGKLRMRLIVSLPIFTAPAAAPMDADLEMIDTSIDDGKLRARFRNPGNTHIRVQHVTAVNQEGEETQRTESAVYLLPGATRDFWFDAGVEEKTISRLVAVTDAVGTVEYEVVTP